jgi:hypothetical protein
MTKTIAPYTATIPPHSYNNVGHAFDEPPCSRDHHDERAAGPPYTTMHTATVTQDTATLPHDTATYRQTPPLLVEHTATSNQPTVAIKPAHRQVSLQHRHDRGTMAKTSINELHQLIAKSQLALGLPHREFGPLLRSSQRTAERWATKRSQPTRSQLLELTRHVHARDPALAAALAAALGGSLEELGIVPPPQPAPPAPPIVSPSPAPPPPALPPPPPPPPVPPEALAEFVVCATADALDLVPRVIRPALRAAFVRARDLGLDVAAIAEALARPIANAPAPAAKQAKKAS